MSRTDKLDLFVILLVLFFAAPAYGGNERTGTGPLGDEILTKLEKVSGSDRIRGEVTASISADSSRVWVILSDPRNVQTIHQRFSLGRHLSKHTVDDVWRRYSKLDEDALEKKFQAAPENPLRRIVNTHEHRFYYRRLEMPWPLSDRWLIMKESLDDGKAQQGVYRIVNERVHGSVAYYRAVWDIEPNGPNRSLVHLEMETDMGFSIPGVLLSLGKDADMPDSIRAIRSLALRRR